MQILFHFWKNSKSGFVPKMENLIKIRYLEKLGVLKDWLNFPQMENFFYTDPVLKFGNYILDFPYLRDKLALWRN